MSRVRVKIVRKFLPHRFLLNGVWHQLETAKEHKTGYFYDWLGAILLSALAIEAIGNTYGEALIKDWKDFEPASPIAKLRLVADECGVKPDFDKHPWETARRLIRFRNRIAHAKPQLLNVEDEHTDATYQKAAFTMPESDLEKMITDEFAIQGYDAIEKILEEFSKKIEPSKLVDVEMDGWTSVATAIENKAT